jgi:hypothetical protein
MAVKSKSKHARKYHPSVCFRIFNYARQGFSLSQIASLVGVSFQAFQLWREKHELVVEAIKQGKAEYTRNGKTQTFKEYVFDRLPEHLKELWDQIDACEEKQNGPERIDALLNDQGKKARQHLFLYALTASSFNASEAMRKVCINRATLNHWKDNDPDFATLMDEIHWHKGNFFENTLINACQNQEPAAIIFANRTFNKDRGYGAKLEVEVSGQVNHIHAVVDLDKLSLSIECRKEILAAVKQQEEVKRLEQSRGDVVDAA